MMRNLVWVGAIVIIVITSGVGAGQKPSRRVLAGVSNALPDQVMRPSLTPGSVVDRILSFDANGDHRIAPSELPERMENVVRRGDENQDGVLTRDEVVALVATQPASRRPQTFIVHGPGSLEDVIADLKLPPSTRKRALAIVNSPLSVHHPDSVIHDAEMRALLGDEDHENLVAAVARLRNTRGGIGGTVGGIARGGVTQPTSPRR